MSVPASGPISINNLKSAFPGINSNSLSAYRGVKWYRSNNSRGFFGNPTISMSEAFDTRPNSPVVPGGFTIYGTQGWTIPLFNKLSVTIKGGDGGQAGQYGSYVKDGSITGRTVSGNGGAGGSSFFGGYLGASGGAGGVGDAAGGGVGQTASLFWDADANTSLLSLQGQGLTLTVGAGGAGGGGGPNYFWRYFPPPFQGANGYYQDGSAGSGAGGAGGYITVSWS